MGWKFYTIFIKDSGIKDNSEIEALLPILNLNNYKLEGEISFNESLNSEFLCAGLVNGSLMITHQNLAMSFHEEDLSSKEKAFMTHFSKSEIACLVYFSTTELYGFSVIKNGKRIRVKAGADGEVFTNIGKKLDIEKEIKKKRVIDKEELAEMKEEMEREELNLFIDNAVGIETSFEMTSWYLGKRIDEGKFDSIRLLKFVKNK